MRLSVVGLGRRARLAVAVLVSGLVLFGGGGSGLADPPVEPAVAPAFVDRPVVANLVAGGSASLEMMAVLGTAPLSFACQWQQAGSGASPGAWADIAGATQCTGFSVSSSFDRYWLRARASASNSQGTVTVRSYAYRVGGELVYATTASGQWVVKAINLDGGNNRQLTPSSPTWSSFDPAVSPDGRRIAFASNKDPGVANGSRSEWAIWLMDGDGSNVRMLADNLGEDRNPAWSPDGSKLVYENLGDGGLYTVRADGSGGNTRVYQGFVTNLDGNSYHWPSYHPNGQSILFSDYTGSKIAQVTPWNNAYPVKYFRVAVSPITGSCPHPGYYPQGGSYVSGCLPEYNLLTLPAAGGGASTLVSYQLPADNDATAWGNLPYRFRSPRYSPDGGQIFTHAKRNAGGSRVLTVSGSGSSTLSLAGTTEAAETSQTAWSPSGQQVLYYNGALTPAARIADAALTSSSGIANVSADADWHVLAHVAAPSLPWRRPLARSWRSTRATTAR